MSVNYTDWSNGTKERAAHQQDYAYLRLDGGAGFSWGELHGFADLRDAPNGIDTAKTSIRGSVAYKTGLEELRLYAQLQSITSAGFTSQNEVVGVSYPFSGKGWFFNPWIGLNRTMITAVDYSDDERNISFSGMNGGMLGWATGYDFTIGEQNFSISNWHETDFGRSEDYVAISGETTEELSANGELTLSWNVTESVTTGVGYRYVYNKLGFTGNQNAMVTTLEYNF